MAMTSRRRTLILLVLGLTIFGFLYVTTILKFDGHSVVTFLRKANRQVRLIHNDRFVSDPSNSDGLESASKEGRAFGQEVRSPAVSPVNTDLHDTKLPFKHKERLSQLSKTCNRPSRYKEIYDYHHKYTFTAASNNYFYPKYKLVYCKVAKVGGTFMVEMFRLLQKGQRIQISPFNAPRQSIHMRAKSARIENETTEYPTVIAARDPYSRLYSAYVDKIVLPNLYFEARNIKYGINHNSRGECANHVTFQQFLDNIVETAKSKKEMNNHWVPISSLCRPCDSDRFMIIKQETFTEDIEDLLRSLHVTGSTYNSIKAVMTSKRIETTIPGIVKITLMKAKGLQRCLSDVQTLEKLWLSFQIQGYIRKDRSFPRNKFNHMVGTQTQKYFSDSMVLAAKKSSMSRDESKAQRQEYLVQAYAGISKETLKEIQNIYRPDFLLFGYSMTPPGQAAPQ